MLIDPKHPFINPERLCYATNKNGQPCRAIAVRGHLQCFAHSDRGRGIRNAALERERVRLAKRPPLTLPELVELARRHGVARYFAPVIAAAQADAKR